MSCFSLLLSWSHRLLSLSTLNSKYECINYNICTDFNVAIGVWKETKVAVTSWSSPSFYLSFLTQVEHQRTIKLCRSLNISAFSLPFTATSEEEWRCCVWPRLLFNLSRVIKGTTGNQEVIWERSAIARLRMFTELREDSYFDWPATNILPRIIW